MRKRNYSGQIGVPVSSEVRAMIEKVCNEREITMAQFVREALQMGLEKDKENLSDMIKDVED